MDQLTQIVKYKIYDICDCLVNRESCTPHKYEMVSSSVQRLLLVLLAPTTWDHFKSSSLGRGYPLTVHAQCM